MYGASVTLGFGGSTLLVTVLTMLADLIGDNVARNTSSKGDGLMFISMPSIVGDFVEQQEGISMSFLKLNAIQHVSLCRDLLD